MNVEIRIIDSWVEYHKAWLKCAKRLPWVKEKKLMHYNIDEESNELKEEFQNTTNIYLGAIDLDSNEIIGCLSIHVRNEHSGIRRWEPLVDEKYPFTKIAKLLLEEGIRILKSMFVQSVQYTLKYEFPESNYVSELLEGYIVNGFIDARPPGVQFIKDLSNECKKYTRPLDITIKTRESYTLEDFCKFSIKAFYSTKKDKEIHSWDKITTDFDTCISFNQRILDGKMGHSPNDFWLVAHIKNKPAGFIIGTGPKRQDQLPVGVIGILGVFPKYRGKGVASTLVSELEQNFIATNYSHSFVGTPETNISGIKFYKKIGYTPFQRIIHITNNLVESLQIDI